MFLLFLEIQKWKYHSWCGLVVNSNRWWFENESYFIYLSLKLCCCYFIFSIFLCSLWTFGTEIMYERVFFVVWFFLAFSCWILAKGFLWKCMTWTHIFKTNLRTPHRNIKKDTFLINWHAGYLYPIWFCLITWLCYAMHWCT